MNRLISSVNISPLVFHLPHEDSFLMLKIMDRILDPLHPLIIMFTMAWSDLDFTTDKYVEVLSIPGVEECVTSFSFLHFLSEISLDENFLPSLWLRDIKLRFT